MSDEQQSAAQQEAPAAAPAGDGNQTQTQTVHVDDSGVVAAYANFCRVSSTPEEIILDMGMNPNPFATGDTTVQVSQRLILNHYTAKRLLNALGMAIQRHEQAFGAVETDVRRRLKGKE